MSPEVSKVEQEQLWQFYDAETDFKHHELLYKDEKADCYNMLDALMHDSKKITVKPIEDGYADIHKVLTVTKVARTSITWFADKLKKRLPKQVYKKVVRKKYTINDFPGLVEYLKSCGVDPKVFAKYLSVEEIVDGDQINKLSDIGEITPHNIAGCYVVNCSKPYYKFDLSEEDYE